MAEGDFVLVTRGEPHIVASGDKTQPVPLLDLDRPPAHLGVVRHGGGGEPFSTLICGYFRLSRTSRSSVLELLPPLLHLKPAADRKWLETVLDHLVSESALERPGQRAVLSRMTEVLFVEVLRSWIESLRPGEGGWLAAIGDPLIGKALHLIHERPDQPWTIRDLGRRVGLDRSAFAVWPERAPLSDCAPDRGGCFSPRIEQGGNSSDCEPRWLRRGSDFFEAISPAPRFVA